MTNTKYSPLRNPKVPPKYGSTPSPERSGNCRNVNSQ